MRIIQTEDTEPVSSVSRVKDPAVIPPFSYVGYLDVKDTGWWYPHSSFTLLGGYISAATVGEMQASISIMRVTGGANVYNLDEANHTVIGGIVLPANERKRVFAIDPIDSLVTPYDSIYLSSKKPSQHSNVVVQLLGEKA